VQSAAPDEEQSFDDLQRVVLRLWVARIEGDIQALIAEGQLDREALDRISALREQVKAHRAAEAQLAGQSGRT
jgi:hypothetical protein